MLSDVRQYFSTISDAVDDEWKTQARKRIRSNALARQKAAEAKLLKLQKDQKGLKSEIMKSINGESAFDTDLLKEMLDENKTAQLEAEKEIAFFQDEVSKEEKQIAWMNTQYKEIRDWAAQFDAASLDTKKMILARLIEKITVDRDANSGQSEHVFRNQRNTHSGLSGTSIPDLTERPPHGRYHDPNSLSSLR